MSLVHRSKKVENQEAEDLKKAADHIDLQMKIREVMSAEDIFIESRLAEQREILRAEFKAKEEKRIAEVKAAQEKAQQEAEWKARRDRIERERGDLVAKPVPVDCPVCGGLCLPSVAAHKTNNGLDLCVRDATKARRAGLITLTQYSIIEEAGALESGYVFTDSYGDGRYHPTGYEFKETDSTPVNPLTKPLELQPIKHVGGV